MADGGGDRTVGEGELVEFNATKSKPGIYQCGVSSGGGSIIEDFETGSGWPWSPWTGGSGGTVGTGYAHDGTYGIRDPNWRRIYTPAVSIGTAGDKLSWWVRPSSSSGGRAYLGFGASSTGCYSLVVAPNTAGSGQGLIIQRNNNYGYSNVAYGTPNYNSYQANKWYKAEVEWQSSSSVTGRLYDSDGTTVLSTATYGSITGCPGGIAIRSFSSWSLDTITEGSPGSGGSNIQAYFENFNSAPVGWTTAGVSGSPNDWALRGPRT